MPDKSLAGLQSPVLVKSMPGLLVGTKDEKRVIDKQSLEYVIRSGIAGGVAGSAAKTLIAPLDRVKILFQTSNPDFLKYRGKFFGLFRASKQIWLNDGIYGLFQGHSVTLLRIFPYAAIKFVAYEQIRTIMIPDDKSETAVRRILAGSFSGLLSVFFTYPLDLIRVRMAFETRTLRQLHHASEGHRGKLLFTIKNIFNENPPFKTENSWLGTFRKHLAPSLASLSNFYRGFAPTIFGMIPYAGVAFYTHDIIHDVFRSKYLNDYSVKPNSGLNSVIQSKGSTVSRDSRAPLKAHAQLFAGGIAGMCSQTAAYPFEVIRRRMQVGGTINQGQFLSFKDTLKLIFKESGFRGFFVGLSIGYMKVIPMSACSFFVYERTKKFIGI